MSGCFVCGEETGAEQGHHVVPQSRGGTDGPVVQLCANHHQLIHSGVLLMRRGKSADYLFANLSPEGQARAAGLIQVALMGDLQGGNNPNPLLAVRLDDPSLMVALKRFQADRGFTSQAAAVNGLLRMLAVSYGLAEDATRASVRVRIGDLDSTRKTAT